MPTDPPPRPETSADASNRPPGFFSELKRRKVYRVGAAYLAVVFGFLQAADLVFAALGLESRFFNGLVLASLLGSPMVVVLASTFDVTKEGIRRTGPIGQASYGMAPDRPYVEAGFGS